MENLIFHLKNSQFNLQPLGKYIKGKNVVEGSKLR